MEFPEPWHQYDFEDWPRLEQTIRRLNSRRRRKGLPLLDPRPPMRALRLDGETPSGIVPPPEYPGNTMAQCVTGGGSAYGHTADQMTFNFAPTEMQAKAKRLALKTPKSQL